MATNPKAKTRIAAAFRAHASHAELYEMGKKLGEKCPRELHAAWKPAHDRPDPMHLLNESAKGRIPELLPIRNGRMVQTPFTFYRGAALNMAADLATTPNSGLRVQVCGDCHLSNFGGFATPERRVVADINDLDESLPAPWEWDVKRLAASYVLASRNNGHSDVEARDAALASVRSYRERMAALSEMSVLDVWYSSVDLEQFIGYRDSLPENRRILLDRYRIMDIALKVVGVGSVGTMCSVALMMASEKDPLFLQVKQARPSVLEPYAGKSAYANHGQRVVIGYQLMQSASDIFLGWTKGRDGNHFYVRQLKDMKFKALVEIFTPSVMLEYATMSGWILAQAHARSGSPPQISGYLGKSDKFDLAIADFSLAYGDQTEKDHRVLEHAVRAGDLEVTMEAA